MAQLITKLKPLPSSFSFPHLLILTSHSTHVSPVLLLGGLLCFTSLSTYSLALLSSFPKSTQLVKNRMNETNE